MEVKYYVVNETNEPINLTEYGVRVEANSRTEINSDFARIFSRSLNVIRVSIEQGQEIDTVSYREFLENSKKIKAERSELSEETPKKGKK